MSTDQSEQKFFNLRDIIVEFINTLQKYENLLHWATYEDYSKL